MAASCGRAGRLQEFYEPDTITGRVNKNSFLAAQSKEFDCP
jgi:hypothetical protein